MTDKEREIMKRHLANRKKLREMNPVERKELAKSLAERKTSPKVKEEKWTDKLKRNVKAVFKKEKTKDKLTAGENKKTQAYINKLREAGATDKEIKDLMGL